MLTDTKRQLPKLEIIVVGPIMMMIANEWTLKQQRAATLAAQKMVEDIAMDRLGFTMLTTAPGARWHLPK